MLPAQVMPSETVLVVEDNPDVRAVAVGRLKRLGYQVKEAETAVDAIGQLSRGFGRGCGVQ